MRRIYCMLMFLATLTAGTGFWSFGVAQLASVTGDSLVPGAVEEPPSVGGAAAEDTVFTIKAISSEELLQIKEKLLKERNQLDTEIQSLLEEGLEQSKSYLETNVDATSATSALILIQRAEYLQNVQTEEFLAKVEEIDKQNSKIIAEWEKKIVEAKAAGLDDNSPGWPQLNLLPDPKKDNSKVIETFQLVIDRFPESDYVDDAMYNMAFLKEEEGNQLTLEDPVKGDRKKKEALRVYQDITVRFSDGRYAPESYMRIAEYYFNRGGDDLNKAIKNYKKVMDYPESPRFSEAVYKLAWTYYKFEDYPNAIAYFTYLVDDVDTARALNVPVKNLDEEAIKYVGICFNRWGAEVDRVKGTEDGGHKLIRAYINEAGLTDRRYADDVVWELAESYNFEQQDTLAIYAYETLLDMYPLYEKAPKAQGRIVLAYQRMLDASEDQGFKLAMQDSVIQGRYRLFNRYKPGSQWSSVVEEKSVVREANQDANDALLQNIYYYFDLAFANSDTAIFRNSIADMRLYLETFPVDSSAYIVNYNMALVYEKFLMEPDSAYKEYFKVASEYTEDEFRAIASQRAYTIAVSLHEANPWQRPEDAPTDSLLPLTVEEQRLVDAIDNYARLFPDTTTLYIVDEDSLGKLTVKGPPGRETPNLLAYAGGLFYDHNDYDNSKKYFYTIMKRYPNSSKVAVAQTYILQSYYNNGDYRSTEIMARKVLENPLATEQQKDQAKGAIITSIFKRAEEFQEAKEFRKAGFEFRRAYDEGVAVAYTDPEGVLPNALFNSGTNFYEGKDIKNGIESYLEHKDKFPEHEDAPKALYNAHDGYAELRDWVNSSKYGEELVDKYPDFSANEGEINAEIVLYNTEVYYEKAAKVAKSEGNETAERQYYEEAIRVSQKFVDLFPSSKYASDVDFNVAKLLFKVDREEEAYARYEAFSAKYPDDPRNVEASYQVGMNHLDKDRVEEAKTAFRNAKERSDGLRDQDKDYNPYYASESIHELTQILFVEFDKITLSLPVSTQKQREEQKFAIAQELTGYYDDIVTYPTPRAFEAFYNKGYVLELFANTLSDKEFVESGNVFEDVVARKSVNDDASIFYEQAVNAYKRSFSDLKLATTKVEERIQLKTDSLVAEGKSEDAIENILEGKTEREKQVSLKTQLDNVNKYRDLCRGKITSIAFGMAEARAAGVYALYNAPTESEPGTPVFFAEKFQLFTNFVKPESDGAVESYQRVIDEGDTLGVRDKYVIESGRQMVRMTGLVPSALAKVSITTFAKYEEFRKGFNNIATIDKVVGAEEVDYYTDPETGLDFYTLFYGTYDAPMSDYLSQWSRATGIGAINNYILALQQAREKNLVNEESRQIEKEMLDFAFEFAEENMDIADTADYYYKKFEADFLKNQDELWWYSDASLVYSDNKDFARENAILALEAVFNAGEDLGLMTLQIAPSGAEIAETDNVRFKRNLAMLAKINPDVYSDYLDVKSSKSKYASNYQDWLTHYKEVPDWQTARYDDSRWFAAAPPPNYPTTHHKVLGDNKAYPIWIGLGQTFTKPELPESGTFIDPGPGPEDEPADTGGIEIPDDLPADTSDGDGDFDETPLEIPGEDEDSTEFSDEPLDGDDSTKAAYAGAVVVKRYDIVVADTTIPTSYSSDERTKILSEANLLFVRKTFFVKGLPQSGTLYIAVDGYYDFYVNGSYVAGALAAEEDVSASKLETQTIPAANLKQGKNVLAILLTDDISLEAHYGLRAYLEVAEIEDLTKGFLVQEELPKGKQLNQVLFNRGRVTVMPAQSGDAGESDFDDGTQ